ncbi:DUF4810 domain-containing protein [Thalassotalea maritima]|uniref:DUF4810 domain-containing protein n=1 Tax=Thalassotalea maritima TaxID=3242416 RepID=UPI00352793A7
MKQRLIYTIAITLFITGLSGCKSTMYHWGDYSNTFYNLKNEPTDETRSQHKSELRKIIEIAKQKKKKVPPSIHFELALLELADGEQEKAISLLNTEKVLFPESTTAVDMALKEIEKS